MGCWNGTCGFSQHSIQYDENIYAVALLCAKNPTQGVRSTHVAHPMTFLIEGKYDDYGSIYEIVDNFSSYSTLEIFNDYYIKGKLTFTDDGSESLKRELNFSKDVGFKNVETLFKYIERKYLRFLEHTYNGYEERNISLILFKKDILQIAWEALNQDEKLLGSKIQKDITEFLDVRIKETIKVDNIFNKCWGEDLYGKGDSFSNILYMLSQQSTVHWRSFYNLYKILKEKYKTFEKNDIVITLSNMIWMLESFTHFKKTWSPQLDSSQEDTFNLQYKYTSLLFNYMKEKSQKALNELNQELYK